MGHADKVAVTPSAGITGRLAEFIVNTRFEDVPAEVMRLARNSFLDTLGLAIGGTLERAPQLLIRHIRELGGTPTATVLAQGFRTNAPNAALINGTAADILGWSDISVIQMTHPSVSICPAVWAIGEQVKASGRDVLLAHVIGVEVADKIGAGIKPGFQLKGWHPMAVLNTFGAAAAAGKLLGLDVVQMSNALGIAGAEASGIRAAMGTMSKAYGAGRSARDGITCALLASIGYTGPTNVMEARDGFLQTFGDGASGKGILENLGKPFEFSSPGITLKKFPACTRSHNGIQGVLNLRSQYHLTPEDVESVECLVTPAVVDYLKFPAPTSKFESKYSMEFCVATALRDGKVVASSFADEKVTDPGLLAIMQRVKMKVWPEYAKHGYNPSHAPYGCVVRMRLKDGREISERVDQGPWEPQTPPSWDDLVLKYRSSTEPVLGVDRSDQSIGIVGNLQGLDDVGRLMDIVRNASGAG
jgi:2-methylcitrate dehydratase PrpD